MKLASELGMSVRECKAKTTISELKRWILFWRKESEHQSVQEYYWAQIAYEIACFHNTLITYFGKKGTQPKRIKFSDYLIKRQSIQEKKKLITKEERAKTARAFWGAFFAAHGKEKKLLSGKRSK